MSESEATPESVAINSETGVTSETVATTATPTGSDPNAPNIADKVPAAAPDGEKTASETPEQAALRESRRNSRKLDRAYRKAAEAEARAAFLERQLQESKPKEKAVEGAPRIEDFSDIEEYAKAKAKHESDKALKEHETKQRTQAHQEAQGRLVKDWETKAARADSKYEDFEEVVGELKPDYRHPWTVAVMQAENAEDVAYHLGKNIKEAQRIAALDPVGQIRAIALLEARLAAEPAKPKEPSKAPAPINPVSSKKSVEATEIRDGMPYKEFLKVRNKQLGRAH
jgi:hypothetical protein